MSSRNQSQVASQAASRNQSKSGTPTNGFQLQYNAKFESAFGLTSEEIYLFTPEKAYVEFYIVQNEVQDKNRR